MKQTEKDKNRTRKAVIYCRVSPARQTMPGDDLGSQKTRCRDYAIYGYEVVEEAEQVAVPERQES